MRDGYMHPIWITRPAHKPEGGSPLIIYFHGGAFIPGTIYNVAPYARGLAKLFGAVVVALTYLLAPEHLFPQGQLCVRCCPKDRYPRFLPFGRSLSGIHLIRRLSGGELRTCPSRDGKVREA